MIDNRRNHRHARYNAIHTARNPAGGLPKQQCHRYAAAAAARRMAGASYTMRRRLFTIIAAGSALICLLATAIWVRGFFATDVWFSNLYSPSARSLDRRSIQASEGWLVIGHSTTLLPEGSVPQSQHPMDSTWAHAVGPPDVPQSLPPVAHGPLLFLD